MESSKKSSLSSRLRGHATILLAHGSKDTRWRKNFEVILSSCRERDPDGCFALAYMEFCHPTMEEATEQLLELNPGIHTISVHPTFLSSGKHFHEDIPKLVANLKTAHSELDIKLKRVIGEDPTVSDAIVRVIAGALK